MATAPSITNDLALMNATESSPSKGWEVQMENGQSYYINPLTGKKEYDKNPRLKRFTAFSEKHWKSINTLVKSNASIIAKDFAPVVKYCPHILDF